MRSIVTVVVLVATLVGGTVYASELSTLQAKLRKYAPPGRIGAVCVCQNGGQFHGHAGRVGQDTNAPSPGLVGATVACSVPVFDVEGRATGGSSCKRFVVLAK
jgi:hypothetical protein